MCTGAILLYKIPRVVIGENENWVGGEELLKSQGVEVIVVDNAECKELMRKFIFEKPEVRCLMVYYRWPGHVCDN
jgi:creatinine deaminase